MKMRKTTEELWKEAKGPRLTDYGEVTLETFRHLVIENERECAEAVADVVHGGLCNRLMWLSEDGQHTVPVGTKLFTFPPAAQVPGWQPIETAPKDMTEVLLFAPKEEPRVFSGMFVYNWVRSNCGRSTPFDDEYGDPCIEATHWMPLPAAPEVK